MSQNFIANLHENDTFSPQSEEQENHALHHFILENDQDVSQGNVSSRNSTLVVPYVSSLSNNKFHSEQSKEIPNLVRASPKGSNDRKIISVVIESNKSIPAIPNRKNQASSVSSQGLTATSLGITRKGKWSQEEEEFVEQLIKEFEDGTIVCVNGTTLRSYLAKRLNCSGMRISKKFAGKNKGNLMFLGRPNATKGDSEKLRKLDECYVQSILRENQANTLALNHINAQRNAQGMQALAMQQAQHTASAQVGGVGVLTPPVNLSLCNLSQYVAMNGSGLPIPISSRVGWNTLPSNPVQLSSNNNAAPIVATKHQQQVYKQHMQQSFMNKNNSSALCSNSHINIQGQPNLNLQWQQDQQIHSANSITGNAGFEGTSQNYLKVSSTNNEMNNITPSDSFPSYASSRNEAWQISNTVNSDPGIVNKKTQHHSSFIKDTNEFTEQQKNLSNDDERKTETKKQRQEGNIRSNSHWMSSCVPGAGLSASPMLQAASSIPAFAINNNVNDSITADSYAEFAQQSAYDVSQHSAYRHDSILFPTSKAPSILTSRSTSQSSKQISSKFLLPSSQHKRFKSTVMEESASNEASYHQQAVFVSGSERSSERSSNSGSGNGSENGSDDLPSSDDVQSGEE